MNLRSAKADLVLKQVALKDAEATLKFFMGSKDCSESLLREIKETIRLLKFEIDQLQRYVSKTENAKKKK